MDDLALVSALATGLQPVRRLPRPWVLTSIWIAASAWLIGTGIVLSAVRPDLTDWLADPVATGEVAIAAVTGLLAAHAAFHLAIPGCDPRRAWLPVFAGLVWLGWVGFGCWSDFAALGRLDPRDETSVACLKFIAAFGTPTMLITLLLARHGFIVRPVQVSLLAGLAAAGVADVGLAAVDHPHAPLTTLIWHGVAALFLIGVAALIGPGWMRRSFLWLGAGRPGGRPLRQ